MARRRKTTLLEPNLEGLRKIKRRLKQALTLIENAERYSRKYSFPRVEEPIKREVVREIKEAIAEAKELPKPKRSHHKKKVDIV